MLTTATSASVVENSDRAWLLVVQNVRMTAYEVFATFGVAPSALEFYEYQGLLMPIVDEGCRFYTESDIIKVQIIVKATKLGFRFHETKQLILDTTRAKVLRDFLLSDKSDRK